MTKQSRIEILKAVRIGLYVNVFLTLLKLITGIFGSSQALISDGLNSFSDVFISIMLLVVLKLATKKPDHDHPYGHEKYEGLAYFVLGIIFILTASYIFTVGIISIISHIANPNSSLSPNLYTVIIAILALFIKLFLYFYYKKVTKKYDSPTLKADAKNHYIDAWASSISLVGVTLSQFGNLIIFDYIASLIIGLFILRLGLQIFFESITYLVDQAPSDEEIDHIKEVITSIKGVIKIDDIKVRKHMTQNYVDVEIGVLSTLTLEEAHKIAEKVHSEVEKKFKEVIHCMVHVNPFHQK
jgi:cation diffusion facilitator family transporter